ncbi:quinohemoprotein ethanol dehydrogenase type-1 precursor [mine drainage metagenome]|uniref:Quinohemoprotein ethanol dehydrogenase type-1 n=1 Tax=mine drainage metagenome TaxID=410659 RepID=A0A1J5R2L9_9ZZZZ
MFRHSLMVLSVASLLASCAHAPAGSSATTEWPSYGKDYSNQRYSPLTQINRDNVARLQPAWTFHSGVKATFQATPIVVGGVMYLSLPFNHVVALDAKTGRQLWRYEHHLRPDWRLCCGPANRGVAVSDGKVFVGTADARLIALDAKSGRVLWDINAVGENVAQEGVESLSSSDPLSRDKVAGGTGVGIAMAPVVYKGMVIVGITGVGYGLHVESDRPDAPLGAVIGVAGRYGRPGFLAAFDTQTGKRIWQFDTIPPEGWEGQFTPTTPDGLTLNRNTANERATFPQYRDAWRFGGGSAWTTPSIDPGLGLLYFGTGNPSPQMDDVARPGDNLYTVSLVALDIASGKLRWHYQQVPHDMWGYDVASPPVLFDYVLGGRKIPAVGEASKTGWFYVHDRATGELLLKSDAFVPQSNLFVHATTDGVRVTPGVFGGANWSPSAVDEGRQQAFVAAMHMPVRYTLHEVPASADKPAIRYTTSEPIDEPKWGLLSSIDLSTGKIRWQQKTAEPLVGGVLATAGGLLFTGEGNGHFDAYDTDNGRLLWQYQADAGVNAPPITYQIDGVQYIAVAAGGNQIWGYRKGDGMLVFRLP